MLKKVLVTLDGSELSEQALDYARQIVAAGGQLILLSVVDHPDVAVYSLYPVPVMESTEDTNAFVSNARQSARKYLDTQVEALKKAGLQADAQVEVGEPASTIVEYARERKVDAIVMSTHGRSGLSRWLFGSVTHKVLSAMPCPVLVIPGRMPKGNEASEHDQESSTPV